MRERIKSQSSQSSVVRWFGSFITNLTIWLRLVEWRLVALISIQPPKICCRMQSIFIPQSQPIPYNF